MRVEDVGRDLGLLRGEPELREVDRGPAVEEDEGLEVRDALRRLDLGQKLRPAAYWNYLVEDVLRLEDIGEDDRGAERIGVVGDEHPYGGPLAKRVLVDAVEDLDDLADGD